MKCQTGNVAVMLTGLGCGRQPRIVRQNFSSLILPTDIVRAVFPASKHDKAGVIKVEGGQNHCVVIAIACQLKDCSDGSHDVSSSSQTTIPNLFHQVSAATTLANVKIVLYLFLSLKVLCLKAMCVCGGGDNQLQSNPSKNLVVLIYQKLNLFCNHDLLKNIFH